MPEARYVIGVDLGTTNSALAFAEIPDGAGNVNAFAIPQLTNPGEVRAESLLPSFLYLPGSNEFPAGSLALPWNADPHTIAGTLARKRGVENSGRLVASAKSWLSHAGVDRTEAMLPASAPTGVDRVSPVTASADYLRHLRQAWDHEHPDAPFTGQEILLTVPASFDEVARELTVKAAEEAGYRGVTLLEEPQAAFYAWIARHEDWRERVHLGDLILVADIGGGTTDFTLIAVTEENGSLALERVAVGEHILLGGDNIDLALARLVAARLAQKGTRIDAIQLHALWANCRAAKEKLLEPGSTETEYPVTILGRGTGLVGGTIKATLTRDDLQQVMDGFFPVVESTEMPARQTRVAVQEIGLPYATDAAVSRHLAKFLRQSTLGQAENRRGADGLACPTHILFNGGVLHSPFVRERILTVLNQWLDRNGFAPLQVLEGEDLMQAVARGAAYYGLARHGKGVRIRGGIPRSYYVGIQSSVPAVPGFATPVKAFTVAQFGMEEGTDLRIPGREFALVTGEPAEFQMFSSATRKEDAPGTMIDDFSDELEELPPMEVHFPASSGAHERVRVSFETVITETGVLQLWCVAPDGRRWKLEFNVRERVTP
ncbi:MAG: Hsp70 family protein [Acidobacteriota bacterium]|nr:Hsp70 family protein [Acidobacteriota bacterium]